MAHIKPYVNKTASMTILQVPLIKLPQFAHTKVHYQRLRKEFGGSLTPEVEPAKLGGVRPVLQYHWTICKIA